jgi:hypothetical protein
VCHVISSFTSHKFPVFHSPRQRLGPHLIKLKKSLHPSDLNPLQARSISTNQVFLPLVNTTQVGLGANIERWSYTHRSRLPSRHQLPLTTRATKISRCWCKTSTSPLPFTASIHPVIVESEQTIQRLPRSN